MGEATDGFAVLAGLALEEGDVAHYIGALVRGEVVRIDRAAARGLARMRLHQRALIVEAHEVAIDPGAKVLADEAGYSALATRAR